jgi:transmembrane sensor
LIARFLSGESTPAESALVRAWAADPIHRAEFDAIRRAWSHAFPLERPIDVDGAWRNLSRLMRPERESDGDAARLYPGAEDSAGAHLRLHVPDVMTTRPRTRVLSRTLERVAPRFSRARVTALAAAAVVFAAAGLGVFDGTGSFDFLSQHRTSAPERKTQDFFAGAGQRALIDLADGTHVVLAPESHLHVSLPTGTSGVRELTLDGEALFTVTHDTARPFVVQSRYGTTVDVGTSFAVRAYHAEPYRVVVREGRVALGTGATAPVLDAGDVAAGMNDGTMRISHDPAAADLIDWTTGRLTFQHTRFDDIVPELERWYGVSIRLATPSLGSRRITGQLDTESRAEAMAAIGRTLGAQHTIHGTHITFSIPGDGQ